MYFIGYIIKVFNNLSTNMSFRVTLLFFRCLLSNAFSSHCKVSILTMKTLHFYIYKTRHEQSNLGTGSARAIIVYITHKNPSLN